MSSPVLSVIVVSANTRDLLLDALRSVRETAGEMDVELIVVDNASTDGSAEHVRREFPAATVIENPTNRGFGAANNAGLASATAPFALLLNSDTIMQPGTLARMVSFMRETPGAGFVGCQLVGADGSSQPSASDLPRLWMQIASWASLRRALPPPLAAALGRRRFGRRLTGGYFTPMADSDRPRRVGFLSGACLLVRRETWEDIGVLDERIFLYLEDVDWCRRAADAGWDLYFLPDVSVVHFGGSSFSVLSGGRSYHASADRCRSLFYYFRKHEARPQVWLLKTVIIGVLAIRFSAACLRAPFSTKDEREWRQLAVALWTAVRA